MKKKLLSLLLAIALLAGLLPAGAITAQAATVEYPVTRGNIYFDPSTGTITDADIGITKAVIPSTIDGVAVKKIGEKAFSNCSALTSVTIPDCVTSFGVSAFYGCSLLSNIEIPDGLTTIEDRTFCECSSLINIKLPDGLTSIGDDAFRNCDGLTDIVFPDGLTSIGDNAFYDCDGLKKIVFPNSLASIGYEAFSACANLNYIFIPSGVVSIGDDAFLQGTSYHMNGKYAGMTFYIYPEEIQVIRNSYAYNFFSKLSNFYHEINYTIHEHSYTGEGVITAPTCTEQGYTTYICTCGESFEDDVTPALGHDGPGNVTAPTCTEGGYTTCICTRCGESYVDDETPALGHDNKAVVTKPTCTEGGYTTYTCNRCGESSVGAETPALGHDNEVVVTEKATCLTGGYTVYSCKRCGTNYMGDEKPALGHAYAEEVTAPTCTTGGFSIFTCSRCADSYAGAETTALGHSWDNGKVTEEPADGKDGVRTFTCTRCGITRTQSIPYVPDHTHSYSVALTNATCTEPGGITYTCTCGDSYRIRETPALGHALTSHDAKAPTCTEPGWSAYEACSRCDYTTRVELPAGDHSYKSEVIEATCVDGGYTAYTCTVCGDSYTANETEALGHNYLDGICTRCRWNSAMDDWIQYDLPGGAILFFDPKTGTVESYDDNSTATKVVDIPAEIEGVAVTAIADDAFWYETNVERITIPNTVTRIGHEAFADCTALTDITIPSSVTDIGIWVFSGCDEVTLHVVSGSYAHQYAVGEDLPFVLEKEEHGDNHTYTAEVIEPDCEREGGIAYTCTICGDFYWEKETDALGHDYVEGTCTRCGDYNPFERWVEYPVPGSNNNARLYFDPETGAIMDYAYISISIKEDINIPEKINGVTVTSIADEAFWIGNLRSITLPKTITYIGEKAFSGNSGLTSITIPKSVTYIADDAFDYCDKLTLTVEANSYALQYAKDNGIRYQVNGAGTQDPLANFTDAPAKGNWAYDGVAYCVEQGLMNGTSTTTFNPNGTVSRAQLVTILYRVAGSPTVTTTGTFTDVPAGQWYSNAIEWAAANGVVNGIGNGKFGPDQSITREQIATILYRYEGEPYAWGNLNAFPDKGSVSGFATDGLIWATSEGLITGVSSGGTTTLAPKNNATRAQIASIIMRYLEN